MSNRSHDLLSDIAARAMLAMSAPSPLEALLAECRRRGIRPSWDGYVSTKDAADLMRLAPKTLRNLRAEGKGPPYRLFRNKAEYPLQIIAEHLQVFE